MHPSEALGKAAATEIPEIQVYINNLREANGELEAIADRLLNMRNVLFGQPPTPIANDANKTIEKVPKSPGFSMQIQDEIGRGSRTRAMIRDTLEQIEKFV